MPIRKGQEWGTPGPLSATGRIVASDAEARAAVEDARRDGTAIPELGLAGGDLARTLGATGDRDRLRSTDAQRLPVDLCSVRIDGVQYWFVSHLVARRRLWHGRFLVAMNAQWLGPWYLAPAGHPNDGRIDITEGQLGPGDRIKARGRLPAGDHLPHPDLATHRVRDYEVSFDRPTPVRLDGDMVGAARTISISVEADAALVVI